MSAWSRGQTQKLIEMMQDYPNISQPSCPDYKNRYKKMESLNEMVQRLELIRPETNAKDLILKIRTLKSQYLKERHRVNSSKYMNEPYEPKLWCYDNLNFWDDTGDDALEESKVSLLPEHSETTSPEPTPLKIIANPVVYCLPSTSSSVPGRVTKQKICASQATTHQPQATNHQPKPINHHPQPTNHHPQATNHQPKVQEMLTAAISALSNAVATNQKPSVLANFLGNLEEEMMVVKEEDLLRDMKWKIYDVVKEFQEKQRERKEATLSRSSVIQR